MSVKFFLKKYYLDALQKRSPGCSCYSNNFFFFSSRRRHTRFDCDWSSDVCSSDLDEFAMGSSNENSAWKPVHNPRDLSRVPGGSSGGAAAAVAADMAVAALGSDTGGSIRQPASFCGVVGLMPTYGRVSRYGLIAFASSLDHIGPLARTVKDAAIVLRTIAGRDPMDSTSADVPVPDYVAELEKPIRGLKIGVAKEYFGEGLDSEVRNAVETAIEQLRSLGCEIVPAS